MSRFKNGPSRPGRGVSGRNDPEPFTYHFLFAVAVIESRDCNCLSCHSLIGALIKKKGESKQNVWTRLKLVGHNICIYINKRNQVCQLQGKFVIDKNA